MENINFDHLLILLQAPSKEFVVHLCDEAFQLIPLTVFPSSVLTTTATKLSLPSSVEATQLLTALRDLIRNAISLRNCETSVILSLFPENFNKSLSAFLAKIFVQKIPGWKQFASNRLTFSPQLTDFDWRVDIATSSDGLQRMSIPTCFLQMQVQEPATRSDTVPQSRCVTVELSPETLDTMIDGLRRIRDQLSSVAAAK